MFKNLRYRFALFMQGRYGTDQLSRFLSMVLIVLLILEWVSNHFLAFPGVLAFVRVAGILNAVLLFVIYFRTFSRNIPRRYAENQKFLSLQEKISSFFGGAKKAPTSASSTIFISARSAARRSGSPAARDASWCAVPSAARSL